MNIEKFSILNKINVLVFGDYMVDEYIKGEVTRISPEAPVPVLEIKEKSQKLGGAGNVINNIILLGGKVKVLGCIGEDLAGKYIYETFKSKNVDCTYFKICKNVKTIIKTRVVSRNQQFIRMDEEEKKSLPSDYINYINNSLDDILKDINIVVISDYAKGSITKDSIQKLIKKCNEKKIKVVVDPKGKDYTKYSGATFCTPNLKELSEVSNTKIISDEDIITNSVKIIKDNNLEELVVTRSEDGISIINKSGKKEDFPALKKEVVDVSGAGDTVVATLALMLGVGYTLSEACLLSNISASVVVSKFGTSPITIDELINAINSKTKTKLHSLEELKKITKDLKDNNKTIVFTNGCFDLLHSGHISSFKQAKKLGDILIVAVNSDKSVKENKGDLRPIINEKDRIEMLSVLEMIDYIILMESKDPSNIIKELEPNICVKGKDWENKLLPEKKVVESYGGTIKFIDLKKGLSTTNIIDKIINIYGK